MQASMLALLSVVGLTSVAYADDVNPVQPHARTIAHDILDMESAVVDVPAAMVLFLDSILDEAKTLDLSSTARTPAEASDVLQRIDQLLTRHGFVVPSGESVEFLRDAMIPMQINRATAERLTRAPNERRAQYIRANKARAYHFYGSDNGAFLYLAIADVSRLPLTLMERPGVDAFDSFQQSHYFIRYRLAGGGFYDWDVLTGAEQRGIDYAITLDRTMTLGYVSWVRGEVWLRLGSYAKATADFRDAIRMFPGKAGIANSLAWLLATCPDPTYRDGNAAIGYAQRARALAGNSSSFKETLAAAFAAAGRFGEAEATERQVLMHMGSSNRRAEYRHRASLYHNHESYLAPRRQEQSAEANCDHLSADNDNAALCATP